MSGSESSTGDPPLGDDPRTEPPEDEAEGESTEEHPAPLLGKVVLTAAPFVALLLLYLLDQCVAGG